jgi:hypothetical protein
VDSVGGRGGVVDAPIFSRWFKNPGICWNVLSLQDAGRVNDEVCVTLQKPFCLQTRLTLQGRNILCFAGLFQLIHIYI